jgi:hypothetical protein
MPFELHFSISSAMIGNSSPSCGVKDIRTKGKKKKKILLCLSAKTSVSCKPVFNYGYRRRCHCGYKDSVREIEIGYSLLFIATTHSNT